METSGSFTRELGRGGEQVRRLKKKTRGKDRKTVIEVGRWSSEREIRRHIAWKKPLARLKENKDRKMR